MITHRFSFANCAKSLATLGRASSVIRAAIAYYPTASATVQRITLLADKRGPYRIVFREEFIVARGGGPILYAYQDTPHAIAMRTLIKGAVGKPSDLIWRVAPFVDQPGQYGSSSYFFEWEREWRRPGNFQFDEADPAFMIIPEDLHEAARHFFDDAEREHLGPNYKCPFIDPYWGLEKIKSVLKP